MTLNQTFEPQTQVTSRLQAADTSEGGGEEEEEEEDWKERSPSVSPDRSRFSQAKPSAGRRRRPPGDPVVSATLQELRRLGVHLDHEALTESHRRVQQTVESSR